MREEFPSLTRITRPAISQEPLAWAFVSGIGAGPIAGGIVRVALLWAGPILLPPTQPHPEWLTVNGLATLAAAIGTGAVLTRAGGVAALALYVVYELLRLVASLPGRLAFCHRGGGPLPPTVLSCDYTGLVAEHWLTWLGVAVGVVVAIALFREAPGDNRLLRASGAFSLVLVVVSTPFAFLVNGGSSTPDQQNLLFAIVTTANIAAGVLAGVLLAGHRLAAAVLLALLIVAPSTAFALPLAINGSAATIETSAMVVARWSGVFVPLAAAVALFIARAFVRMGSPEAGTES